MKSSSFIDFSSWIIQNSERNLRDNSGIFTELTGGFWPATKIRNQRWKRLLDELEPSLELAKPNDDCWAKLVSACNEIVLSETVTRIWFAVIISRTGNEDIIDVAQCIVPDHVGIRKRALRLWKDTPASVAEFAQRTQMVKRLSDQANDLMLSQVSEEVVGRNLSISFETFDKFFACRCEYQPEVLKKANRVLSQSYSADIARLSPLDCINIDLNKRVLVSICKSFDDDEIEFPEVTADLLATTVEL